MPYLILGIVPNLEYYPDRVATIETDSNYIIMHAISYLLKWHSYTFTCMILMIIINVVVTQYVEELNECAAPGIIKSSKTFVL